MYYKFKKKQSKSEKKFVLFLTVRQFITGKRCILPDILFVLLYCSTFFI